jgi:hypothetical protein
MRKSLMVLRSLDCWRDRSVKERRSPRLSEELLNPGDAFGFDQICVEPRAETGGAQVGITIGGEREETQCGVLFAQLSGQVDAAGIFCRDTDHDGVGPERLRHHKGFGRMCRFDDLVSRQSEQPRQRSSRASDVLIPSCSSTTSIRWVEGGRRDSTRSSAAGILIRKVAPRPLFINA